MSKRIFKYFDVYVPPFKKEPLQRGGLTIYFVLQGKIPSKKNNQQAVTVRKHARKWANDAAKNRQPTWADVHKAISMCSSKMRGNAEYRDFVDKIKPILQHQSAYWYNRLSKKGLVFPLQKSSATIRLYFKNRYITDTVNKQQTIQDALTESGILANDDYRTLNPINSQSACYYEEIVQDIAFITLFIQA